MIHPEFAFTFTGGAHVSPGSDVDLDVRFDPCSARGHCRCVTRDRPVKHGGGRRPSADLRLRHQALRSAGDIEPQDADDHGRNAEPTRRQEAVRPGAELCRRQGHGGGRSIHLLLEPRRGHETPEHCIGGPCRVDLRSSSLDQVLRLPSSSAARLICACRASASGSAPDFA